MDRTQALGEIARLVREHALTIDDITGAMRDDAIEARATPLVTDDRDAAGRTGARADRPGPKVLVRVLGFLGGTFIFAGVGVFIALQWDQMNSVSRVVVTLGLGLAAFTLAALARRDSRFERAATPLYLVAAVMEPAGMLVAFDEFGSGGDWRWASLAISMTMAVQYGLTFKIARRSTLLFVCISFAAVGLGTALDLSGLDDNVIVLTIGASLLLAAVWADRIGHGDITPLWYFAGAGMFLGALFDIVESTALEPAFIAAAAGFVYLSVTLHSRTLLVVATLAILGYTGWFTAEHFADSIGWPLALVAFGVFMIGLSALAVRIDRRYVRQ